MMMMIMMMMTGGRPGSLDRRWTAPVIIRGVILIRILIKMMSFIDLNRVLQTILSVLRKTKILLFLKRASTFYLASQIELRSWRYADICTFIELKWIYKKVKSTSNLHTQNEGDKKSPQIRRKFKKERSLSVNSYLLSPPPVTPKRDSGNSANTSPR